MLDIDDDRFWWSLLVIGCLLSIIAIVNSDLGLDTHIRMNAANSDDGVLEWGHTRTVDPLASDPTYTKVIEPQIDASSNQLFFPLGVMTIFAIGLFFSGYINTTKIEAGKIAWSPRLPAILSIYPVFIFAIGRGYFEPVIAMVMGLSFGLIVIRDNIKRSVQAIILILALASVMYLKGLSTDTISYFVIFAGTLNFIGQKIDDKYNSIEDKQSPLKNPLPMALLTFSSVSIMLIGAGFFGFGSSLSIIGDSPLKFSFALFGSLLDVVIIFGLFGMMLWPLIIPLLTNLKQIRSYNVTLLTSCCAGLVAAIWVYVAVLWTFEAELWGAKWPDIMWILGNNGRYISLLIIPLFALMAHTAKQYPEMPSLWSPKEKSKTLLLAIILVLPLTLLASLHGQSMWTDEAAEVLSDSMNDDQEFIFIHEPTLAMHWLYTIRTDLDLDGQRNITGHWRAPDSGWQDEVVNSAQYPNRGDISSVQYIVVAPDIKTDIPEGWEILRQGEAPWLNGGNQWAIWGKVSLQPN
ncbi:MAG: hypothetical protein GWO84_02370 [Euryarchaeota archaeon]|nr:hypothetical protein [Euryarchaeota archaeon]